MRSSLLLPVVLLAACGSQETGVKAIVGARLDAGGGAPPIEYSVVVIAAGKFRAVGTQAAVPVPKGADITRGIGRVLQPLPEGGTIEAGQPASLLMRSLSTGTIEATMRNGEWIH
jgi:hypothetical protein